MSYNPEKDFAPVTLMAIMPLVVAAHPAVPAANIAELVALAKAKPGTLSFASPGAGSSQHLTGELLNVMAGINIVHVPYKGAGQSIPDVISGQVPLGVYGLLTILPHVKSGRMRLLAVTTLICIVGTVALAWAGPGMVAFAVVFIVVSNVAYSMGENLCAAFLPEIATPQALGKVSGWGWSLGYFGGILALGISLAWVMTASARGSTTAEAVGGTMIIIAKKL